MTISEPPVPFGQLRSPDSRAYRAILQRIDETGYFTNHGPLLREFELRLAVMLCVDHVVVCANEGLALVMLLRGAVPRGRVLLPAFGPPELVKATIWARHVPVFYDAYPEALEAALAPETVAVVVYEPFGTRLNPTPAVAFAARNQLRVVFYAPAGLGSSYSGLDVPAPDHATVFSFEDEYLVGTQHGGCVATSDGELAAILRNVRSSYGAGEPRRVPVTANGRFSELQAGLGLFGLDCLEASIAHSRDIEAAYLQVLGDVPGLSALPLDSERNAACFLLRVDSREFGVDSGAVATAVERAGFRVRRLVDQLLPKRFPGLVEEVQFPSAEALSKDGLLLPVGSRLSVEQATQIAEIVVRARD